MDIGWTSNGHGSRTRRCFDDDVNLVLMFPGQSSFRTSMLADAAARWPDLATDVLEDAGAALCRDLRPWLEGATDARNEDLQLGVFLANHIHLCALRRLGLEPYASLGLSLGELNHVVEIGALGFIDAVRLVSARGRAYDAGPSGMMAAVFPLEREALEPLLPPGVEIVGFNSPTQHVIAGEHALMQRALERLEADTYARIVPLQSKLPMHHSRFASVADAFEPALAAAPWQQPHRSYRPNTTASVEATPSAQQMTSSLARQVCSPVRWTESIERLVAERDDITFIEVGPGSVLVNLLRPRWRPEPRCGTARMAELEALLRVA